MTAKPCLAHLPDLQGFLIGLHTIPMLGGLIALTGAALAPWLVCEREIEREQAAPAGSVDTAPHPSVA